MSRYTIRDVMYCHKLLTDTCCRNMRSRLLRGLFRGFQAMDPKVFEQSRRKGGRGGCAHGGRRKKCGWIRQF
eukprot:454029-Amorphochlora_amoeboformis.AAC.1